MNWVTGKIRPSGLKVVLVPTRSVRADAADVADRHAPLVLLLVDVPVAADFHLAPLGEEVDHGDAHAVQTAGGLVGPLGKLAAELEHGHHALQRGEAQVGMDLDGDAAAVVLDRHRAVVVDGHGNDRGKAGHRFVDRVVDHFVDQVVQPADRRIADVHAGPLADVLQVGQVLELVGAILALNFAVFEQIARSIGGGIRRSLWLGGIAGLRIIGRRIGHVHLSYYTKTICATKHQGSSQPDRGGGSRLRSNVTDRSTTRTASQTGPTLSTPAL